MVTVVVVAAVVVAAVVVAAVVVAAVVVVEVVSGSAVAMSLVERGVPSDTISCCCCSCVVSAIGGMVLVAPMVTSAHSNHYLLDWQRMTSKMCIVSGQERF